MFAHRFLPPGAEPAGLFPPAHVLRKPFHTETSTRHGARRVDAAGHYIRLHSGTRNPTGRGPARRADRPNFSRYRPMVILTFRPRSTKISNGRRRWLLITFFPPGVEPAGLFPPAFPFYRAPVNKALKALYSAPRRSFPHCPLRARR